MTEINLCLPAEWEVQSGLLLTWPHIATDWQAHLDEVERVFLEISRHTSQHQTLIITCHDTTHKRHVDSLLQNHSIPTNRYRLFTVPSNDSWVRDHGPVTVIRNNKPYLLDFTFNGWGEKYSSDLDNKITTRLHKANAFGHTPLVDCDFVLEGGSIETDGQGTFLTTKSCLLSQRRNKGLTRTQIESRLSKHLGAQRVIWFDHGCLQGDDTDGHIDTLIRFADAGTLVYTACKDNNNPNFESLHYMETELRSLRQTNGEPYHLVPLPLPTFLDCSNHYLPASYANFLIINDTVLAPIYNDPADDEALYILDDCFDGRSIIGIDCIPLIKQNGSLHCVTMQLPAGVLI